MADLEKEMLAVYEASPESSPESGLPRNPIHIHQQQQHDNQQPHHESQSHLSQQDQQSQIIHYQHPPQQQPYHVQLQREHQHPQINPQSQHHEQDQHEQHHDQSQSHHVHLQIQGDRQPQLQQLNQQSDQGHELDHQLHNQQEQHLEHVHDQHHDQSQPYHHHLQHGYEQHHQQHDQQEQHLQQGHGKYLQHGHEPLHQQHHDQHHLYHHKKVQEANSNMSCHSSELYRDELNNNNLLKSPQGYDMCLYPQKTAAVVEYPEDESEESLNLTLHQSDNTIPWWFAMIADVDTATEDDHLTPLHMAAKFKKDPGKSETLTPKVVLYNYDNTPVASDSIGFLLNCGADINASDKFGQTPLHYAAMKGNIVAVTQLLANRHFIALEAVDCKGLTPLHMAVTFNKPRVVDMLIAAGSNIHCKDQENLTPLHAACSTSNLDIAKSLLEAASRQNEKESVRKMLADRDIDGNTCLNLAVENGNADIVKLCLDRGADVHTPNNLHIFPLHLAVINGDISIVKMLVDHHAGIDALDRELCTPLHKAAQYNHTQVVEFLVERGADLERHTRDNYTPLLLASHHGHVETIDLLIQKNANVMAQTKNGETAVFLAARGNHEAALEALLKHEDVSTLINESDCYDNDPLHIAAQLGHLKIVKCLLRNGAELRSKNRQEQTPIHLAAMNGRTHIVMELLKVDKSILNDQEEHSNTPLHLAATEGHTEVARVLIKMGANVASRNMSFWTPLDCAADAGWVKTGRVLLQAGSPTDPMDKENITPLHLAARNGHVDVVELLLENNADITIRDAEGNNCLDLAIDNYKHNTALAIVESQYWREALRNYTVDPHTKQHYTPMRKLIVKMPEVAKVVFNKCMTDNDEPIESEDYEITFDFEFLDDLYSAFYWQDQPYHYRSKQYGEMELRKETKPYTTNSSLFKRNHPLSIMVSSKQEELLAHPLVTALLKVKWNRYGRLFYFTSFAIYAIFLAFLTGYILSTEAPYMITGGNDNDCHGIDRNLLQNNFFTKYGKYVVIGLATLNLIKEIFQLLQARLNYLCIENLIEWVMYITSILFVIDFEDCQKDTSYRMRWQWNVGTMAIFLAWTNLMLFAQKFPRFGIYVVMFKDILQTFIQFFLVFMMFIIAFALAFHVSFQNQESFANVWKSLVKTSAMMVGELDYSSLFIGGDKIKVYYKIVSNLIFCIFVVVMSIIIMNLLVGLAVDNIKEVQEKAELTRKAMQVELALDVERLMGNHLRKEFMLHTTVTMRINHTLCPLCSEQYLLSSHGLSKEDICTALHPEPGELENVKETQEELRQSIKRIHQHDVETRVKVENVESMIKALLANQGIRWPQQDGQNEAQ